MVSRSLAVNLISIDSGDTSHISSFICIKQHEKGGYGSGIVALVTIDDDNICIAATQDFHLRP